MSMKALSIVVALAMLGGGCTTRSGAKTAMVTGGVITLAGVGIGAIAYEKASDRPSPYLSAFTFGGPVIAVGTILAIGGLINYIYLDATTPR